MSARRAVVVGAGVAGLAAAWELQQAGVEVMVLESERRAGGVIVTERHDGFLVEGGPDGWLAAEPDIPALARDLGIAGQIVPQRARGSALWTGATLEPLEEGRAADLLGIQTNRADLAAGFHSFTRGMGELIEGMLDRLSTVVRSPLGVTGMIAERGRWRLAVTGGAAFEADGVVLAIPAFAAGRLLEQVGVQGARDLGAVPYFPSSTVSLAYAGHQLARPLEGTGFVVAATAGGSVRACTFASQKFPGRAPADHVLVRVFVNPTAGDAGAAAHEELTRILGIGGEPLWRRAYAWTKGIPRYNGGHHDRLVADVRRRLERLMPLAIAGAGYDGAGVSACVRSGRQAGREIVRRLSAA